MSIEGGGTFGDQNEKPIKGGGDMAPKDLSKGKTALDDTVDKFKNKNEKLGHLRQELFVMTNSAVSPESCKQQLETIEKEIKEITDETLDRLENRPGDDFEKMLMNMVTTYGKDFVLDEISLQKSILDQEINIEKNYRNMPQN